MYPIYNLYFYLPLTLFKFGLAFLADELAFRLEDANIAPAFSIGMPSFFEIDFWAALKPMPFFDFMKYLRYVQTKPTELGHVGFVGFLYLLLCCRAQYDVAHACACAGVCCKCNIKGASSGNRLECHDVCCGM